MKNCIAFILLLLAISYSSNAQILKNKNSGVANIKVADNWTHRNDTLFLRYYPNTLDNMSGYKELQATMANDSTFNFKFPVTQASGSFFIGRKLQPDSIPVDNPTLRYYKISDMYQADIDDNIFMKITEYVKFYHQYKTRFFGKGSAKYQIKEKLKMVGLEIKPTAPFNDQFEYLAGNSTERQTKAKLKFLKTRRIQLTNLQFEILKAEIVYGDMSVLGWVDYYNRKSINADKGSLHTYHEKFRTEYNKYLSGVPNYGLTNVALLKSRFYIQYVLQKLAKCDFIVNQRNENHLYLFLKKHYLGEIRDQLLTTYFLRPDLTDAVEVKYINDAITTVKSPYCLERLKEIDAGLASGYAYDFALPNINGKIISMDNFKGKVILMDFWYTGCGMCVHYYTDHLSAIEEYFKNNSNVVFISICIDQDKDIWRKSVIGNRYTSENIINLYTEGLGSKHKIISYYNVTGYPTVLLIGKDSKIIYNDQPLLHDKASAIEAIANALK